MPLYYPDLTLIDQLVIGAFMVFSAVIIAGVGSYWLMETLAQTGVLAQFPSGRQQTRV